MDIRWLVKVCEREARMLLAFLHLSPSDGASGRSRHTFDPRSQVKTDTKGSVHYEAWRQPHDETTRMSNEPDDEPRDVLTKPKILPIEIKWERIEPARANRLERYVISAVDYQRLLDAVKRE